MMLFTISIAPAVVLILFFYTRDRFEKEPQLLLWKSFFLGAIAVVPVCLLENLIPISTRSLRTGNLFAVFVFSFFVAGLMEEGGKYLVLRYYAYPKRAFNEPYDGIMYSVMISLGFATVENVCFVLTGGLATGILRAFLSVPAHALFAVVMGYYAGLAKFTKIASARRNYLLCGWIWAAVLHGLYNFLILSRSNLLVLMVLPLILVCWKLALKAMRLHSDLSPFKDTAGLTTGKTEKEVTSMDDPSKRGSNRTQEIIHRKTGIGKERG